MSATLAGSAGGAPPITSTTSPRIPCSPNTDAASATEPRQTSSYTLVNSRTTATGRLPSTSARSDSVPTTRLGASRTTVVRSSDITEAMRCPALSPLAGQEPLHTEAIGRQATHHQCRHHRRRSGHHAD